MCKNLYKKTTDKFITYLLINLHVYDILMVQLSCNFTLTYKGLCVARKLLVSCL